MGFFDPAYRKMLTKSPACFQQSAAVWGAVIEAEIIKQDAAAAGDVFRAAVIGMLALEAAKQDPTNWSTDALRYIETATQNARRLMPAKLHVGAMVAATTILRMGEGSEAS